MVPLGGRHESLGEKGSAQHMPRGSVQPCGGLATTFQVTSVAPRARSCTQSQGSLWQLFSPGSFHGGTLMVMHLFSWVPCPLFL